MSDFIWHNPRCSKSRQTLVLIEDAGREVEVIEYLKTPPSPEELAVACVGLGCRPIDIIRSKEAEFEDLGLALDDDRSDTDWLALLAQHPTLIERPIVCLGGRYALGRPPENVSILLQAEPDKRAP